MNMISEYCNILFNFLNFEKKYNENIIAFLLQRDVNSLKTFLKKIFSINIARNLQDLIKNLKILNVNSSINNNVNDNHIFYSINDCYNFMKKNIIIIVVDEKFNNDFH